MQGRLLQTPRWAAALSLWLALPVPAQPAAPPPPPAQVRQLQAVVPPGWVIEQRLDADFNHDRRRDALLLLRTVPMGAGAAHAPPAASPGAPQLSPPRRLLLLLRLAGGWAVVAHNDQLIPQLDLATQEDPWADGELLARPGGFELKLGLLAGVGSYQSAVLRYRFRLQPGCVRLIGWDRLQTHRATLDTQDWSVNFLTGAVQRSQGNAQRDGQQVQRERLADNPRRCLPDLGSALDFKPL